MLLKYNINVWELVLKKNLLQKLGWLQKFSEIVGKQNPYRFFLFISIEVN